MNKGEKDDDLGFEEWWMMTLKTSIAVEEKKPLTGIGGIAKYKKVAGSNVLP